MATIVALVAIALLAAAPAAGASGASLVRDIAPGPESSSPEDLTTVGRTLFFTAGRGKLLPRSATQLWRTTAKGAGPLHGIIYPSELTDVRGTLFLSGTDPSHRGLELWRSDGTAKGTRMVRDINPGPGSSHPENLTNVAGTLFFTAGYMALWRSDGTAAGTRLVRILGGRIVETIGIGHTLFFTLGGGLSPRGGTLWRSDGTAKGTVRVPGVVQPKELTDVGGTLFFSATDGTHGRGLWRSDGTAAGTKLLGRGDPHDLTNVAGTLFFTANGASHGRDRELWRSDGTVAGTKLVRDINRGLESSFPQDDAGSITNVGGTAFFRADDGIHGSELWRSNGTAKGTRLVRDILPGRDSSYPGHLTNVGGTLFFDAYDDVYGVIGSELWRSNGTAAGTRLVRDIAPGSVFGLPAGSYPDSLTGVGRTLYFSADDGIHGRELWKAAP